MLTRQQLQRISAWACVARDMRVEGLLNHYPGDLCYDGASLAASEGPFFGVIRDYGSDLWLLSDTERTEATFSVNGPTEDNHDRRRWFFGYLAPKQGWDEEKFQFVPLTRIEIQNYLAGQPIEQAFRCFDRPQTTV